MNFFRKPGQFCWLDIKSSNIALTKHFYGELFGWQFKEQTFADRNYTKIFLDHEELGGLTDLKSSPIFSKETPSHVSVYVAVQNVDEAITQVLTLGGEVLLEPFDVLQEGRMATIQDPTGAVLSLWEAKNFHGINTTPYRVGTPSWFELINTDVKVTTEFYVKLFKWTVDKSKKGPFIFKDKEQNIGGFRNISDLMGMNISQWCMGVSVKNVDDTIAKAQSLGAQIISEKLFVLDTCSVATFISPDSIVCGVIENN